MVGGPSVVFCQHHKSGKSQIYSHQYTDVISCARVIGIDANSLYLYCSGQEMPCGKEVYVEVDRPDDTEELCSQVMKGILFGFLQVNIHVPDELIDTFIEFCLLFVINSIPDESIPTSMHEYQIRTRQKSIKGTKKLLGVMCATKILLCSPILKWYQRLGLKVTTIFISTSNASLVSLIAGFWKK